MPDPDRGLDEVTSARPDTGIVVNTNININTNINTNANANINTCPLAGTVSHADHTGFSSGSQTPILATSATSLVGKGL